MNGTLTAKKTGKCSATGLKIEPGDEVIRFGKGYALADQITVGEVEPTFVYINDPPLDEQSELRRMETLWRRKNEARAMRVEKKRMIVDHWRAGSFRVIAKPCKCGRDHLALECRSAMGIEEVCPVTWWTWLAMLSGDAEAFIERFPIEEVVVRSVYDLIPDRIPEEEWERWLKMFRERQDRAMEGLRAIAPGIAGLLEEEEARMDRERMDRSRDLLHGDDEDIL